MSKLFDLIIANPPYGKSCSLCKPITKKLLQYTKDLTVLTPKANYKDKELWRRVKDIKIIENCFDALIQHLSAAHLTQETENKRKFEEVGLNERQLKLLNAIDKYNETHEITYNFVRFSGTPVGNKLDLNVKESCVTGMCNHLEPIQDIKMRECIESQRVFIITHHGAWDGVHTNEAHDYTYNFNNEWLDKWNSMLECPVNPIIFLSKEERDNFREWWYSCVERERVKKLKSGLTNACLNLMSVVLRKGADSFESLFPHLDWTRSWTDKEVLIELGLPEDFLENN